MTNWLLVRTCQPILICDTKLFRQEKPFQPLQCEPSTLLHSKPFFSHSIIKVLTSLSSSQLMRPFKSEHWMQTHLYKLKKGEHSKFSDSNVLSDCLSLTRFARSVSSLVTILLVFIRRARRFFQFPFSPLSHHSLIPVRFWKWFWQIFSEMLKPGVYIHLWLYCFDTLFNILNAS